MDATPLCRIFGVRHLSPAGAVHLQTLLQELRPTAILVEGPCDGTEQLPHLAHAQTQPPIAILSYTKARPIRSILCPLARYSPEWVALQWGLEHRLETRFIDLPSGVFLAEAFRPTKPDGIPHTPNAEQRPNLYTMMAQLEGEPDHETWWERRFEHVTDATTYTQQMAVFGEQLRKLRPDDFPDNEAREAHMRRVIHDVLQRHDPAKVVVVCGAYHRSALIHERPPMTDDELAQLLRTEVNLTLMPYSYYRLSAQSGYGAGNNAPAYYERIHRHLQAGTLPTLGTEYLTELAGLMRREGKFVCSADVIEAVRLATHLAALKDAPTPTLADLHDAAITCMGNGIRETIRGVLVELDIGTAIGKLPKGVVRTSIQDDFYETLHGLHLAQYHTEQAQQLDLDLRPNRYVKDEVRAHRDLLRSTFFHRLNVLGIIFAEKWHTKQRWTTWKESWKLRWTPDSEIQLVENALVGDTLEQATVGKLRERLTPCERIDTAAELVRLAANCCVPEAVEAARQRMQALAVDATNFVQLAGACSELAELIRYGSVRQVDPESLKPLLAQLFLRATLGVVTACLCDDSTARDEIAPAVVRLTDVGREHHDTVDDERWRAELEGVALKDHVNPYLAGYIASLMQARFPEEQLAQLIGRRLSVGNPPARVANWVEGLLSYNREALLQRVTLWQALDAFLIPLDEDAFRAALVPLRRAFSVFAPGQVRRIVSHLVEVAPHDSGALKESVDVKLSDEEAAQLRLLLGDLSL